MGHDEERSRYDEERKVILTNLDHPMVAAALEVGGVNDVTFRRLSYEIAMTQYALALAREVYLRDPGLGPEDVLFEVRDALRRITLKAAILYAK
ncbi:MAG: hypothetical protein L6R43_05550 [Planctomycetes bacterium]|nr:hypothetical protein [Planctomycetota bacterium]